LILRKISTIGATRRQIIRLKCTKFDFCWGSASDPAGGAYSAPPDLLAAFKGPISKGREGKEVEGKGRAREREGEDMGGKGGKAGLPPAPQLGSLDPPVSAFQFVYNEPEFRRHYLRYLTN